jgi:hypothetical protein
MECVALIFLTSDCLCMLHVSATHLLWAYGYSIVLHDNS